MVSTEDALPYKEPESVNTDPDVPLQPDNDIVTSPEVIDTVEDAISAIEADLIAVESLSSIPAVLAQHKNHVDQANAFIVALESTLLDPLAARRLLSTTGTGTIACTDDIISLEETTGNAARSHWDSLINKINKLASTNIGLVDDSESVGSGILEKMKGLKKQVQAYKSGKAVNVGRIAGSHKLDDLIRNTQVALQEDIGMKLSFPLDSAVDELARMAAKAISSGAPDGLAQVSAKGVKQADQLATQYKIRDPEYPILGYQRKTMDDQITLPQGIIMSLSGSDRKYNYPRYASLKGSAKTTVELSSQQVKQLYDIGMFIGREIAEQSRVWEFRLGTLKALNELAKKESRNVDADRNTWAAEQKAAASVVRMWSTNAAARRHYIATYNKIAYLIFELLSSATGSNIEPSQELLGGLFRRKPQAPKLTTEEKIKYIHENIDKVVGSGDSGLKLVAGEGVTTNNVYALLTNELPTFNNNAKPAMVKRLYSALNSAIKYTEGKPELNREEPWVDFQSDVLNQGIFKPERIIEDMALKGDRWVTMHKVLVNLVWTPKRISMDWSNGNNHVAIPLADAPTLKKLFPLVERMWREVDPDVTRSDALKFNEDLWGPDHFAETICTGYGNYIRGNIDILDILIDVFYMSVQPPVAPQVSQEFFGPFKKKPKAEPKVEDKPRATYVDPKSMLAQLPKANIDPGVSHNLVAYSNSFPEHVKLLTKAAAEVNAKFNIANIKKFGVELNKLADQVMESFKHGDSDNDWKTEGNKALQMLLTEVEEQRLWGRFFGVDNIGGVFETSFKTAPNVRWDNKESTERIPNANLGKQSVSGVDLTSATQLCKLAIAFPDPGEVNGVAQNNKFLKSFPKFDDAMYYHFEEPIQDVLMQLDDIIGNSYDLLLLAAVTDPGDHEFR